MNPQAPIIPPESSEVFPVPSTPLDVQSTIQSGQSPQSPQKVKDNHWISILAMAIFVVLSLGVVAFLYYQNQALKSMLASLQTPIAVASPTPTRDPGLAPEPVPLSVVTANWKTYTNKEMGIEFRYPSDYSITNESIRPYLNRNIGWGYNNTSVQDCKGGCPAIDTTEKTILGGKPATKIMGYLGGDGGNIPQKYITYEVFNGIKYFDISIQTLPFVLTGDEASKYKDLSVVQEITPENQTTFNQILSTFKFTGATPTPVSSTTPMYAKEGESCGALAGAAGNARCAPGLTCQHQDPNNYNIGTCAK